MSMFSTDMKQEKEKAAFRPVINRKYCVYTFVAYLDFYDRVHDSIQD